jgi:hypothetical protein
MPTTLIPSLAYSIPPLENIFHRAFTVWNPEARMADVPPRECKTHSNSSDAEYWSAGQEMSEISARRRIFYCLDNAKGFAPPRPLGQAVFAEVVRRKKKGSVQ